MIRRIRRTIAALFTALALGCAPTHRPSMIVPISYETARGVWVRALQETKAPTAWVPVTDVVQIDGGYITADSRILGLYLSYLTARKNGEPQLVERIILFVRHDESDKLVQAVLYHEYLHALYARFAMSVPGFTDANPDSEGFVCAHGGCEPTEAGEPVPAPVP